MSCKQCDHFHTVGCPTRSTDPHRSNCHVFMWADPYGEERAAIDLEVQYEMGRYDSGWETHSVSERDG